MLVAGGADVIWRTDGVSGCFDDLQFTLGLGPGVDAAASGDLVLGPIWGCQRSDGRCSRLLRRRW